MRVFPDHQSLSKAAADRIAEIGLAAVAQRGRFDLVLSGGETPRDLQAACGCNLG